MTRPIEDGIWRKQLPDYLGGSERRLVAFPPTQFGELRIVQQRRRRYREKKRATKTRPGTRKNDQWVDDFPWVWRFSISAIIGFSANEMELGLLSVADVRELAGDAVRWRVCGELTRRKR